MTEAENRDEALDPETAAEGIDEGESSPADDAEAQAPVVAGYIIDFVSGVSVRATPEEVEAVQVFARRLVEDFGYGKSQIQTRPQYFVSRVLKNPS